ncbi:hypothetical protein ABPG72_005263 [Tetrahymena utriculariae]
MHLQQSYKVSPSNSLQVQKKSHSIDISFKNISYSVIQKQGVPKNIHKHLTGVMKSGEVTAILGPSGGGKTSLSNILSGKIVDGKNIQLTGKIMSTVRPFQMKISQNLVEYVMQNDILLDFFTVRDAIQFAADLKINGNVEKKRQKVNEIIKLLKLERCQNTQIGGEHVKGISGGERKRVNIACELISDPQVLFLDGPTSGLDSFTSFLVIKLLKDYAKQQNKNVIMSIHSPNKDIWDLFDNVIFMSQGRFVYQGKAKNISNFFDQQGLICPKNMCKADYYMSQISATNTEKILIFYMGYFTNMTTKQSQRYELGNETTLREINNRNGILFLHIMSMFMSGCMQIVISFPSERGVYMREVFILWQAILITIPINILFTYLYLCL